MDFRFVFPRFKLVKKITLIKENHHVTWSGHGCCPVWPLEGVKVDSFFLQFLLDISGTFQVRGLKFLPHECTRWTAIFTIYTLFWYHAPFDFEKLKTRIVKKFQVNIFYFQVNSTKMKKTNYF